MCVFMFNDNISTEHLKDVADLFYESNKREILKIYRVYFFIRDHNHDCKCLKQLNTLNNFYVYYCNNDNDI